MNKAKLLKVLNPILFILLAVQLVSILLIKITPQLSFIYILHNWNGAVISLTIIIHLILNFGWIKSTYFSRKNP